MKTNGFNPGHIVAVSAQNDGSRRMRSRHRTPETPTDSLVPGTPRYKCAQLTVIGIDGCVAN